jgi:small subunit ribosomal protein S17
MTKIFTGTVTSTNMEKTVKVKVERKYRHSLYEKVVRKHKNFLAHNEKIVLRTGDTVKIKETRPLSKNKHFEVIEKIEVKPKN